MTYSYYLCIEINIIFINYLLAIYTRDRVANYVDDEFIVPIRQNDSSLIRPSPIVF